jgi:hypothetical protein
VAIKLGWFAVRTEADLIPVLQKVRSRAANGDVPEGFRVARCVAAEKPSALGTLKGLFKKAPPVPVFTGAVMLGWEFHAVSSWAQAVSQELKCVAVSFFVFDGTWNYSIFDCGEELAAMAVYSLPEPTLYGNVERAASLFGVEPDLFRRYEAAFKSAVIEDGEEDDGEGPPFPGRRVFTRRRVGSRRLRATPGRHQLSSSRRRDRVSHGRGGGTRQQHFLDRFASAASDASAATVATRQGN